MRIKIQKYLNLSWIILLSLLIYANLLFSQASADGSSQIDYYGKFNPHTLILSEKLTPFFNNPQQVQNDASNYPYHHFFQVFSAATGGLPTKIVEFDKNTIAKIYTRTENPDGYECRDSKGKLLSKFFTAGGKTNGYEEYDHSGLLRSKSLYNNLTNSTIVKNTHFEASTDATNSLFNDTTLYLTYNKIIYDYDYNYDGSAWVREKNYFYLENKILKEFFNLNKKLSYIDVYYQNELSFTIHYHYDELANLKRERLYNHDKLLVKETLYLDNGNIDAIHFYDEKGNREVYYYSDDSSKKNILEKIDFYDAKNVLINSKSFTDPNQSEIDKNKEGIKDGPYTKKSSSGKILISGAFKDGMKYGTWKYYNSNGKLKSIENYSRGLRHGAFQLYSEDGSLSLDYGYYEDKPHGVWIFYSKKSRSQNNVLTGNRTLLITYKFGVQEGLTEYYYNGNLFKRLFYNNGIVTSVTEID